MGRLTTRDHDEILRSNQLLASYLYCKRSNVTFSFFLQFFDDVPQKERKDVKFRLIKKIKEVYAAKGLNIGYIHDCGKFHSFKKFANNLIEGFCVELMIQENVSSSSNKLKPV